MTLHKFLTILEANASKTKWKIIHSQWIVDKEERCPIVFVHDCKFTDSPSRSKCFIEAGKKLALDDKMIDEVADAADGRDFGGKKYNRELRSQLLDICGLR